MFQDILNFVISLSRHIYCCNFLDCECPFWYKTCDRMQTETADDVTFTI